MEDILTNSFDSCAGVVYPSEVKLLDMEQYRRSPNRGSGATRPKRNYTTPQGDVVIRDLPTFMAKVTSPFNVEGQYDQNHNDILKYFVEFHLESVTAFMCKVGEIKLVQNNLWLEHFSRDYERLNKALAGRIKYMIGKVGEYSARQDSNYELQK